MVVDVKARMILMPDKQIIFPAGRDGRINKWVAGVVPNSMCR